MPATPAALASRETSFSRTRRIGVGRLVAQDLEGEGQQRVACEDGGRLVEGLVRGGLAAAQVVVVHGRKVVMHQRIAVHAFECGAGPSARSRGTPNRAADSTTRKGLQPLALAQRRIAHGFGHPAGGKAIQRQQPVQQGVGFGGAAG